jgi:hypothetical protein
MQGLFVMQINSFKENISYFVTAVETLGVARYRLFDVSDLYDSDMVCRICL